MGSITCKKQDGRERDRERQRERERALRKRLKVTCLFILYVYKSYNSSNTPHLLRTYS